MNFDLFDSPELLDIQRQGFYHFLNKGIPQLLGKQFPITVKNGNYSIELHINEQNVKLIAPDSSPRDCILKMKTYSCKLYAQVKIICKKESTFARHTNQRFVKCRVLGTRHERANVPNLQNKSLFFQDRQYKSPYKSKICTCKARRCSVLGTSQIRHECNSASPKKDLCNVRRCSAERQRTAFERVNVPNESIVYQSLPEWVLLGQLPLMTKRGHFIINGSPRVVVHQVVRSPGIYFQKLIKKDEQNIARFYGDIIPLKGVWVRLQMTKKGRIEAKFKKGKKVQVEFLQKCLQVIESQITLSEENLPDCKPPLNFTSPLRTNLGFVRDRSFIDRSMDCNTFLPEHGTFNVNFSKAEIPKNKKEKSVEQKPNYTISSENYSTLLEKRKSRAVSKVEQDAFIHTYDKLYRTTQDKELEEWQKKKSNLSFFKGLSPENAFKRKKCSENLFACFKIPSRYDLGLLGREKINDKFGFSSLLYDSLNFSLQEIDLNFSESASLKDEIQIKDSYLSADKSKSTFGDKFKRRVHSKFITKRLEQTDFLQSSFLTSASAEKSFSCNRLNKSKFVRATREIDKEHQLTSIDLCSASIWLYKLRKGEKCTDDIDHSQNRRVRTSGELLQTQFENGVDRLKNLLSTKLKEWRAPFPRSTFSSIFASRYKSRYNDKYRHARTLHKSSICVTCERTEFRNTRQWFPTYSRIKALLNFSFTNLKKAPRTNYQFVPTKFVQAETKQNLIYTRRQKAQLCSEKEVCKKARSHVRFSEADSEHSESASLKRTCRICTNKSKIQNTLHIRTFARYTNQRHIRTFVSAKLIPSAEFVKCLTSTNLLTNRRFVLVRRFVVPSRFVPSRFVPSADEGNSYPKTLTKLYLLGDAKLFFKKKYKTIVNRQKFAQSICKNDSFCKFTKFSTPLSAFSKRNVPNTQSTLNLPSKRDTENSYRLSIKELFSTKPITGALREFFGSNPLSQYMDQTNPLAEVTHKRRMSSLGIGGVSRDSAGMAIRGIHPTHYGRICPIETPEGKNAGLVNSLAFYTKVDINGFLKTPYYRVVKGQIQSSLGFSFNSAKEESLTGLYIAPSDLQKSSNNVLRTKNTLHAQRAELEAIPVRVTDNQLDVFKKENPYKVELIGISPIQMISVATSLIPFLEHNDANRALMGSNMQRQAVPLMISERPIVGTGLESIVIIESGHIIESSVSGFADQVTANKIIIDRLCTPPSAALFSAKLRHSTRSCSALHKPKICVTCERVKQAAIKYKSFYSAPVISEAETKVLDSTNLLTNRRFVLVRHERAKVPLICSLKLKKICTASDYFTTPILNFNESASLKAGTYKFGTFVSASQIPSTRHERANLPLISSRSFLEMQLYKSESALLKQFVPQRYNPSFEFQRTNLFKHMNFRKSASLKAEIRCKKERTLRHYKSPYKYKSSICKKICTCKALHKSSFGEADYKYKSKAHSCRICKKICTCVTCERAKSKVRKHKTDSFLMSSVNWLTTFSRSNQNTCITEKPLIQQFDWVQKGDVLSDCSASNNGELAVGKNVLVAYIPWEGYNFEDAIVINERLVREHVYTSLHIERYTFQAQDLKDGNEWFTKYLPGIEDKFVEHLEESGLPKIGSFLKEGDIIVGKIRYLNKKPSSPYERLLCDILGEKNFAARNKSLYVPKGVEARVIYHRVINQFDIESENKVRPAKAARTVNIFLGEKRPIQIGDKISGRHGNKGVISTILPRQDMPYLPDGTPIDIILNPLGVPSRMNVGQVLECLLGLAADYLNQHFKITAFDERYGVEASKSIVFLKLYQARLHTGQNWLFQVNFPGKTRLVDGRSGLCFDQWITVGKAYILKLIHMVSEKIHARSTGPYALITQQPLRGRSNKGGQRLGEMEVWALEGFGAAYTLQELLTKKSDDFSGRKQIVDSILPNPSSIVDTLQPNYRIHQNTPVLGHPEIFKVLLCELQALCLDLGVYIVTPESFQRSFLGIVT